MVQLADLFSVPEMCLLCNVAEYFERNHVAYHPEILFRDIKVGVWGGWGEFYFHIYLNEFLKIFIFFPEFSECLSSDYA